MVANEDNAYTIGSPPPTLPCPRCPRYFKTKSGRTRHIQAKHPAERFQPHAPITGAHVPRISSSPQPSFHNPSTVPSSPQPSFHNPSPVPSHFMPSFHDPSPVPSDFMASPPPLFDGFNANPDIDMDIEHPHPDVPRITRVFHPDLNGMLAFF